MLGTDEKLLSKCSFVCIHSGILCTILIKIRGEKSKKIEQPLLFLAIHFVAGIRNLTRPKKRKMAHSRTLKSSETLLMTPSMTKHGRINFAPTWTHLQFPGRASLLCYLTAGSFSSNAKLQKLSGFSLQLRGSSS